MTESCVPAEPARPPTAIRLVAARADSPEAIVAALRRNVSPDDLARVVALLIGQEPAP